MTSPFPLNNPVLGRMLQERQQAAQNPQPALPSPTPDAMNVPPEPQTVARVEHTHDIAGMGQADTGGLAPQPIAPQKPLAKVQPIQPNPAELGHQQEYNRLTGVGPDPNQGKSGISQIHNPVGRTLLQIADAVGGGLFPRIAMNIPGTQLHHNMLVRNERGALEQEQGNRAKTASEELEAAKAEHQINTEDQAARTPSSEIGLFLQDPQKFAQYRALFEKAKTTREPQFIKDGQGNITGMVDANGAIHSASDPNIDPQAKAIMEASKPKEPTLPEGERPLQNADNLNKALEARFQVLNPGKPLPEQFRIPPNATQKDYDRVDKALEALERATGTREQQNQTNEMRRQTMAIAASNRQQKTDTDVRKAAFKAYEPAMDSAERFNVMAKNYEDAVKNHDQQAMLSLLANHLGMTMGLQKGSRLTRDIIREAETSRPWLQGMQAKFDKDGYLSGVNLTPMQMRQMVNLGRERFSEDVTKGRSEARYMGANDEGPERTPSKATINHYIALANGDPKKAKELAAADGWTVK